MEALSLNAVNVLTDSDRDMSKPPLSGLTTFICQSFNLRCTSDDLFPGLIHLSHSQRKTSTSSALPFPVLSRLLSLTKPCSWSHAFFLPPFYHKPIKSFTILPLTLKDKSVWLSIPNYQEIMLKNDNGRLKKQS